MGRAHHAGIPRLYGLRDPAERPRHHGAHGARHPERHDHAGKARERRALSQGDGGHQAGLCRHEDLRRRPALYENKGQRAAGSRLSCRAPRAHHRPRAGAEGGRPALRRHHLSLHRRPRGQHGLVHPEQLHHLRRGRRRAGDGHLAPKPRRKLLARPRKRQLPCRRQEVLPHHYSRLPAQGRRRRRSVRRDGRVHAAAGSDRGPRQHARLSHEPAGGA